MITTRNIKAEIPRQEGRLKQVTTKDINVNVKVPESPNLQKTVQVSTHNIADVEEIAEKKRRDEIMAEKKTEPTLQIKKRTDEALERFWMQYAIVEVDELLQGMSRRELK